MSRLADWLRVMNAWLEWDLLSLSDPSVHIEGVQHLVDMLVFSAGLLVGMIIGCTIMYVGIDMMVKGRRIKIPKNTAALVLGALVFSLLAHAAPSFAQTATPVPLNIPTDVIFTQTNSWMATFAPIAAIGIGISIALAVLGYLGKMIKSAFN